MMWSTSSNQSHSQKCSDITQKHTLRKKCPYSELFWSAFSRIRTKYERYSLSLCIQSKCRKMRIRITPNTDTFHTKMLMPVNRILQTVDHTLDIYLIKIKSSKKVKLVMRKEVMEQKRFIRTRTIYYKEELELTPRQLLHLYSITSQVTKQ